jgi:hypothetical protein
MKDSLAFWRFFGGFMLAVVGLGIIVAGPALAVLLTLGNVWVASIFSAVGFVGVVTIAAWEPAPRWMLRLERWFYWLTGHPAGSP